jgi:uncharacterized damage-inducible protein DinB
MLAAMSTPFELNDLLAYCEEESHNWRRWFAENAETLTVPLDNVTLANEALELVLHIVAVDLRYSERLLEQPITQYKQMPKEPARLFAIHHRAFGNLRTFLGSAKPEDWNVSLEFPTRAMGTLTGTRRKIFAHTLLHSVRHWAQLATMLRQAGYKQDWQHDFLFTRSMD